MPKAPETLLKI